MKSLTFTSLLALLFLNLYVPSVLKAQLQGDLSTQKTKEPVRAEAREKWASELNKNSEIVVQLAPEDIPRIIEVPLKEVEPFLAVSVEWTIDAPAGMQNVLQIAFSQDGHHWEPFIGLYREEHVTKPAPQHVSQLLFADKHMHWVRLELKPGISAGPWLSGILIHFYSPGATHTRKPSEGKNSQESWGYKQACPCPHPAYQGRLDWCPDGNCPTDPTPVYTNVTHLIVHHSAGSNVSSDWAARVRAIWNYHVNSNGWDDIGYNWLIDPNGVLYEGRADNLQGAHFCGHNSGTMGVCVMGTYSTVLPTEAAINTLKQLLAWKCCKEGIDPEDFSFHNSSGLNLYHISGHRDGCSTECPGNAFYPTIPQLREDVAAYIDMCPQMAAPINLSAEALSDTEVQLQWIDNSFAEDGFLIERSFENEDNFQQIATAPADSESLLDLVPQAGAYYYRLRAYNAMDTSAYSETAYVLVQTTAVSSGLSAKEILSVFPNPLAKEQKMQLSWLSDYRGAFTLELLDVYGRTIWRKPCEKEGEAFEDNFALGADCPPGCYLVCVKAKTYTRILRLMIR